MFSVLAVIVVIALLGLLAVASQKPDIFRVERSTVINAPPENIFPHINELKRWAEWSPYEKKDPNMKRTFSGPPSGKGAAYAWDGNKNVGSGRMEITEAVPSSKVVMRLDFLKPFEAHNTAEFMLKPEGNATRLTWAMFGPATMMSKVMGTVMDMDKMVGGDFAVGLETLKKVVEG